MYIRSNAGDPYGYVVSGLSVLAILPDPAFVPRTLAANSHCKGCTDEGQRAAVAQHYSFKCMPCSEQCHTQFIPHQGGASVLPGP